MNQHLKEKIEFLEEEIAKERSVNGQNKQLLIVEDNEAKLRIKEVEAANARTIAVNQQLIESNRELMVARDMVNNGTINSELKYRKNC